MKALFLYGRLTTVNSQIWRTSFKFIIMDGPSAPIGIFDFGLAKDLAAKFGRQILVSFKNIDSCPSYGPNKARTPLFGLTYFGRSSAIFGQIRLKIFTRTQ